MKYLKALPTGGLYRIAACALCSLLISCSVVGPDSIRSGRLAYNEAITETNNQQMLMVLVHNRYEESNHLLAVSSVTANVRVSSSAKIEAGIGDSDNYDGNLVPFSGGFAYEENPTISYMPVTGETYLRQLMSPIPLSLFSEVTETLPSPEYVYNILLSSVNDIQNPAFLYGSQQDDPRFDRIVALITELAHQNSLYWLPHARAPGKASLVIEASTAQIAALSNELLELLGLPEISAHKEKLAIPIFHGRHGAEVGGIGIGTRTIWSLVEILTAAVEVPAADVSRGVADTFPRTGRPGRNIRIKHAQSRPKTAYVAVEHRDGWFYIEDNDLATKRYFKLMSSLWASAMAMSINTASSSPVLTVPVSR